MADSAADDFLQGDMRVRFRLPLRSSFLAVALVALLAAVIAPASAAPVTYNLVLTPSSGTAGGTGSFTVDGLTGLSAEVIVAPNAKLLDLFFDIGGLHIDSDDAGTTGEVLTFVSGQLAGIVFQYRGPSGEVLNVLPNFTYQFATQTAFGLGTVTASVAPVPAPAMLGLLGTALATLVVVRRRRA